MSVGAQCWVHRCLEGASRQAACHTMKLLTDAATDAPARANTTTGSPRRLPHTHYTFAPSQAPLLLAASLRTLFMGCKTQPTFAEREINIVSGKGRMKTVNIRGKCYLSPPSNAKRNIKEIAFLERLKGSTKSSSVSRQRFPSPGRTVRFLS